MAYTVALPDGRTVEFPDSVSREKAAEIIRQQLGGAGPESGGMAALKAGFESLKGSTAALLGKTGIMDIEQAAQYQKEKEAEAQRIFKPTEKGWTEDPLTKLAELGGGSLPYMVAPVAAGVAAGALPLTGAAAVAAGLGATGLTSLAQFTGTNLGRQIQEGKTLQQTELGPAALAALPQAALDVLPLGYLPGVRQLIPGVKQIFAAAGKEIPEKVAEQIIKQGTINTLKDYGATALKSMGAEGVTEAGQQFFERLQAGLNLTDEKARDEYWQSLVGGAVLGGALAPAGRYVERGQIADQQAKDRRAQEAERVKQQTAEADRLKAEQEAYKQTPDFLKDVSQRYETLQAQLKTLDERASAKPDKNDLVAQADKSEARQERDALKKSDETLQLVADYRMAEPRIRTMREEEEQARVTAEGMKTKGAQADLFGAPTVQDQTPLAQLQALAPRIKALDDQIKAAQKAGDTQQLAVLGNQRQQLQATIQPLIPSRADLTDGRAALERYLEDARGRMQSAETNDDIERHAQQAQQYKQALDQLDQYEPFIEAAPNLEATQKKIKDLQGSLAKARELGEQEQVLNILPKLRELEGQVQPQLFEETKAGTVYAEPISDKKLAEEMAAGRERAKQIRESFEAESAKLRGFAERKGARTPAEQALFDMRTEEARRLRDQFAQGEQDWSKLNKAPEDTQYHQDRLDLQKKLKERVVDLQMELDRAPEAPDEADTFAKELAAIKDRVLMEGEKPPRFKQNVQKELDATQQSLADLERRIAIGEKYRKTGEVAENIIVKETDKNIADLLDRLLPRAIKPSEKTPAPAPRRVAELPIQSAQDQLARLKDAESLLKSLNKQIQAAGKPKDPAKVEALDALKVQRKFVKNDIEAAKIKYNRLVELEQPGAAPKAEPTQGDLFGGLEESRAEINALDKKLEGLYVELKRAKADANRLGAEAETPQLKALVEKFQKRDTPRVKEIQAEIERLESRRESATGERSQQYDAYLKARATETEAPEGQRAFDKRLSGFKEETLKPVAKEEVDAARTKYVELQSMIESIRSAMSKQDSDGGKALREAAADLQKRYEEKTQKYSGTYIGFTKQVPQYELLPDGTYKPLFENAKGEATLFKSPAEEAYWKSVPEKVQRLLNMSRLAAAAKKTGALPTALRTALDKAQADQAGAKAALDTLESKQRAYEQQQAVITGATPGEAEAKRLLAGEGYRTAEGFVRTAPKKKESWGIKSVPKSKEAKPSEVAKAAAEVEKTASLVKAAEKAVFKETPTTVMTAQDKAEKEATLKALKAAQIEAAGDTDPSNPAVARRNKLAQFVAEAYAAERATKTTPIVPAAIQQAKERLNRLQAAVNALDPQANNTFDPEKSGDIYIEIQDLQEEIGRYGTQEQFDGLSAIIKGINLAREKKGATPGNLYVAPFKRYESMMRNAEAQVNALDAKLNQLKAEYDTIVKNESEKAPVVVEADLANVIERATPVDKSHTKAVLAYKLARRDMLAYQYEMGKYVREQYRAAVQALQAEVERQGKDATLPAAVKERDAAVAKLKETQDRLAAAEAKLKEAQGKARARAKEAETLPLTAAQAKDKAREERRQAILRGEPTELQNLPAFRVERDTSTPLAQAVQNNAKRMLGMSRAALESATNAKEREEATLAVQRYERELAEAFAVGERKVTTTGEYGGAADTDADAFELQQPVPGERLAPRRVGPLVREARQAPGQFLGAALDTKQGSQNPPRQAGAIKLRASDLDPESANAISLVTLKGKLDAAKDGTKRKTTLENQYKLATDGLTEEQIRDRMVEGQRLLSSGETLEVIAANEKRREARFELLQAESYLRTAKTPAAKEIAQDDVDTKQAAYDAADRRYDAAKTAAAAQGFKGTAQADVQAADAVEEDLTSTPQSRLNRLIQGSDEFEFSKGTVKKGLTASQLQAELDKAVGGKGVTQSRVQVFDSVEDFYAKDRNAQYDYPNLPTDAKAFVDPKTGQAFMFANNIGRGEGLGVFLHEVGVHLGFRNLFNANQYNALVKAAKTWVTKNDGSLEARVAKAAVERVEAAKTNAEQYDDELLAYTVEEAIKAGAMPSALKKGSPITNWLSTVLNLLKKALAKFGISPSKLTAGDLVNLAYGAAQLEVRGTWHGSDATFEAFDTSYAGTGEGAFDRRFDGDNSLGAGPYVTPDKAYGEYYQNAIPFGKAANESGYGRYSYQDYAESLAEDTQDARAKTTAQLQRVFESNLLHRYLNSLPNGGNLDPTKNTAAVSYIPGLKKQAAMLKTDAESTLASQQKRKASADRIEQAEKDLAYALRFDKAVDTLDVSKIKGLTERPSKGNLYRTLDDIPRENVFSVNSEATVGKRPKIDALLKKYGPSYELRNFEQDGKYNLNSLYYDMRKELGVEKTNALLKDAGIEAIEQKNDRKYTERAYLGGAPEILAMNLNPVGPAKDLLFSRGAVESAFIGREAGKWDTFKGNLFGLAGRVQLVDRLAAADKAIVEAEGAGKLTSTEAFQTQYFMRTADQTTQGAGQFITYGPVKIVSEQRSTGTEYRYQSESGANLVNMAEHLDEAAKAGGLNPQEAERMLTSIIAGERAIAIPNGWARLQAAESGAAAKAEYEKDIAYLKANPEVRQYMDAAKDEYKRFNDGLVDFVAQCGAITKEDAAMFKGRPYIPFYRVDNDVVKLFTDSENSITIGNIKDNPDLQRMMGDNKHILPVLTSAVQNAFMLTRMGLQNQATKTTADAMFKAGFATKIGKGSGPANVNTVHYKIDGKPAFAVIDADTFGIPAHLIVKGMEGIKTTIPALVQMMGVPADILRKFVTRSPAYVVRQLIRDPVNSFILSGVDGVPVLNALKEISNMRAGRSKSEEALMRGLAISSNVYSGNEKDMQKFLQDISSGKGKWEKMLGWLDTMALQADAATRATIYQDSLNKGFSEAQAQFRALESQNFSRRGLSPSMQMLSTMIPFFNAQVQGLDVLYRSMRGRMPFAERLDIQRKIAARGVMLTTIALAYALAMQDDEAYKKASPEERYNNFFVRIPGVKDPLKIPIPYEIGLLFKALPEAILDVAMRDTKAKEAALGMGKLILQSAPGVIPIGGKPLIEAFYGQTAFGPIESAREKQLQASMRYRENTTELAKVLGSVTGVVGVSPLMMEHLVRGYTGSLGLAAMHTLDPLLRSSSEGQKASLSAAQQPFIGGLFQKEEGRWLVDRAYDRMDEIVQAQKTFEDLIARGQGAEARAFAQKFSNKLALADDAGSLRKEMGELYSMERAIRVNPKLTTEQKDLRIEQLKKLQNKLAEQFVSAVDRTTPQ